MLFNSIEYLLLFIPVVFCLYFLLNKFKLFKTATCFLLLASLFFYGSYKIEYVYILIISIILNYSFSKCFNENVSKTKQKYILITAIIANIGILIGFKYFIFLSEIYTKLVHTHFNAMEYIMPLGISFFIIQQISYIIDCYKGEIKEYNFLDYALFVSFFPQLVAGPVVRHQEMIPQFKDLSKRVINQQNIFIGIFLITVGLLKKTVFADHFSSFIDIVLKYEIYRDFYAAWFWGISKVLQGYFDFSGYCDMALGSAFLFNISLPWNFNSPYQAQSILDHWQRWNMTFIRFLKDYIYIPFVKNSSNMFKICLAIMFVFFIYGIWQGSGIVNIIYGLLTGLLICLNKIWIKFNIKLPKVFSIFLTFTTLVLLTPFINIKTIDQSILIFKTMLGHTYNFNNIILSGINLHFVPNNDFLSINLIILIICLYLVFFSKNSNELALIYAKKNNILYTIILAVVFLISTLYITKSTPFIYFAF